MLTSHGNNSIYPNDKRLVFHPAIVVSISSLIAALAIVITAYSSGCSSLYAFAAFCLWLSATAASHSHLALFMPESSYKNLDPAQQTALERINGQTTQPPKKNQNFSLLPVNITIALGVIITPLALVLLPQVKEMFQWRPTWDTALGSCTIAIIVLFFARNFCRRERGLWLAALRICASTALILVILSLAWSWVSQTFHILEPIWLHGLLVIILSLPVLDSLISEFIRILKDPIGRYNTWGPGAGLWMFFFLNESEAKIFRTAQKENAILAGTSAFILTAELRKCFLFIFLGGLMVFWLATAFTTIPLGHQGVVIALGKTSRSALKPGLHIHPPWPFVKIILVNTQRIHMENVGFHEDLKLPLLGNEEHLHNGTLMLCASGEEFITASIAFFYKVNDAPAFHKAGDKVANILKALVLSSWVRVSSTSEGMQFIFSEKTQITNQILKETQKKADELQLGIHIVFVGIRDAHPPAQTAHAYQQVTSAQEILHAEKLNALADVTLLDAQAQASASEKKMLAQAAKTRRISLAQATAVPFATLLRDSEKSLGAIRAIKQFNAIEKSLSGRPLFIISSSLNQILDLGIDLRRGIKKIQTPQSSPFERMKTASALEEFPPQQQQENLSIAPLPRAEPDWDNNNTQSKNTYNQ